MIQSFLTYFQIEFSIRFNQTIYYLQQIPLVKKVISDKWYKSNDTKLSLQIVTILLYMVSMLVMKGAFYGALFASGFAVFVFFEHITLSTPDMFVTMLIVNTIIGGGLGESLFLQPFDKNSTIVIKLLQVPPKTYYINKLAYNALIYIIFNTLVLSVFFYFLSIPLYYALLVTIVAQSLRIFLTSLTLQLYKWKFDPSKQVNLVFILTAVIVAGAWMASAALLVFNQPLSIEWAINGWTIIGSLLLLASGIAIWKKEEKINGVAHRMISFESLRTTLNSVETAHTSEVTVEIEEYKEVRDKEKITQHDGIEYLNALFFERMRHYFSQRIKIKMGLVVGISALAIAAYAYFDNPIEGSERFFYLVAFISFLASNNAYLAEDFSKVCFYNLDRKLMKYRFYRIPEHVMTSIKIRFFKVLKLNTPMLLMFMFIATVFYFFTPGVSLVALVLGYLFQLLLMIFFSLNYLILYYTLQPYTESMKAKSPVYTAINGGFLSFYLLVIHIETDLLPIVVPILTGIMIVYLPIGLLLVKKRAPKHFKLRTG